MISQRATTLLLSVCAVSLLAVPPAVAQSGDGPLKRRLQDKIQSEVQRQSGQARAQIERQVQQQIAARPSPAEMAKVGQVQTALNYFTFDAGPVDGLMGQQTRAAIEEYQAYLDYPVTGQLAEDEAQFLMTAYQGAQTNSGQAQQVAATHPDGIKGLLQIPRDGVPPQPTGVIPSFPATGNQKGVSAFCAQPAAALASKPSMDQTLRPLFCTATASAIAQSDALAANVAGFTPAQIEEQCVAFEPALVSIVASVSEGPASDVVQGAAEFVQRTGQDPEEMAGIAKVCVGVGYRRDQIDLAIGSAVLLTALEAPVYAEYAGYHLALGVGANQDATLARSWFEFAMQNETVAKSDYEAQAVERLEALRGALMEIGANGLADAVQVPSFSVNK
ncbi:MAG: peptidoglycan-binding domain-containing protein [Pseudomonadota bacterium]